MTGGSTEIPIVAEIATKFSPNAEISAGDKLSSVEIGLAYDARRMFLQFDTGAFLDKIKVSI